MSRNASNHRGRRKPLTARQIEILERFSEGDRPLNRAIRAALGELEECMGRAIDRALVAAGRVGPPGPEGKLMGAIAAGWREYEQHLLDPIDASPVQRRETRRAFYAGAWRAMTECLKIGRDGAITTDEAVRQLVAIEREVEVFFRDVGTSRERADVAGDDDGRGNDQR